VPWATAAAWILGSVASMVFVIRTLDAVAKDGLDASEKARALAEGISEAMNCVAFSVVLVVPCTAVLLGATLRRG
jgi:hypothetical protein